MRVGVHRSRQPIPGASLRLVGMSTEPKPAELPLPGGRPGATVRLHPLLAGEMLAPTGFLERPTGRLAVVRGLEIGRSREDWTWLPIPAFVIEHPGAGPILVDTGLHPSIALDPGESFGRIGKMFNDFRMNPDQGVAVQLRTRGIAPEDIGVVVMTHLHADHASGVSEFPEATFVLDGREWESATRPRGALHGYRKQQFDFGFDWRTIDYDSGEVESFASFGRSVDLFGDGSVRLLSTPGHTLGHQSVLLRLREREALLTGDAAYQRRTIDETITPLVLQDEHRFSRSLKEIQRYVERTPGALIITGHDPELWAGLEPLYQ